MEAQLTWTRGSVGGDQKIVEQITLEILVLKKKLKGEITENNTGETTQIIIKVEGDMDTRTETQTNKEGDITIRERVIIIMIMEGDKIGSRGRFPIKAEAEEGGIISRAGHSLADKVREGAGHRGTVTGAAEEDNKVIMMKETKERADKRVLEAEKGMKILWCFCPRSFPSY